MLDHDWSRRSRSCGKLLTADRLLGLLLGRSLAYTFGHAAHWIGAGLLIATGCYAVVQAVRGQAENGARLPWRPAGPGSWWSPGSR